MFEWSKNCARQDTIHSTVDDSLTNKKGDETITENTGGICCLLLGTRSIVVVE
jgi:hypothetical protein